MSSSAFMDSGKFSGGHKSNFSQTCTLLSRYLQEKGSFGDLSLGLSANLQPHGASTAAATTKNLLPMIEKSGQNMGAPSPAQKNAEPGRAQMTIFYAGQVIVFNDFPADKAKEIMAMASKNAGSQNPNTNIVPSLGNSMIQQRTQMFPQTLVNDMPIVRKASLARFFEKRKDRITARAPYQVSKSMGATSRPIESKTWLGLAAQSPQ